MSFRPSFHCLWCDAAWTTQGPDDLEGWAQLCPTCLGKAGSNGFLRRRLRDALAARASAAAGPVSTEVAAGPFAAAAGPRVPQGGPAIAQRRAAAPRPATRPAFPDDWFLRRGEFERGAIHDAAWAAELDVVTRRLDDLGLTGTIIEPGAGVGFFSPLLADHGELFAYDADAAALDRARDRLLAHRLRAHLHVADPWAPPAEAPVADVVVAAFLLGRVRGAGLDNAAASLRARLREGGRLALVDLRPDGAGGPPPGVPWTFHDAGVVEAALRRAGFGAIELVPTGRFFLTGSATAR